MFSIVSLCLLICCCVSSSIREICCFGSRLGIAYALKLSKPKSSSSWLQFLYSVFVVVVVSIIFECVLHSLSVFDFYHMARSEMRFPLYPFPLAKLWLCFFSLDLFVPISISLCVFFFVHCFPFFMWFLFVVVCCSVEQSQIIFSLNCN